MRLGIADTTQERPNSKQVRTMQIMEEVILFALASKETRKLDPFLVSSAGGPAITPTLNDPGCHSTTTLLQAAEAAGKKNSAVEIKLIGMVGLSQTLAEDVLNGIIEFSLH